MSGSGEREGMELRKRTAKKDGDKVVRGEKKGVDWVVVRHRARLCDVG